MGSDWPSTVVPSAVRWPSDWVDGMAGESEAVGGPIVGLRLEYVSEHWMWRIRSTDQGKTDLLGEADAGPASGVEALIDAADLSLVRRHGVTLSEAETMETATNYHDAVQASSEEWPGPRLVELQRVLDDRQSTWRVTTYDTEDGTLSSRTL
ncbi:hypothetical protein [Curtobacterium sp. MCBD17_032]|uniref:hypothetical protein n=1 Tax=Curtobacterium sp. MCBD17_032 TaxID=2175659 RepID=UPI000DB1A7ED|nr:hypothetical protein [Curtobacterium sp. MCBD17_032]PZE84351.1 hypothetical protein DEI91_08495 [Curtobacterium sp. MCBD17_032]